MVVGWETEKVIDVVKAHRRGPPHVHGTGAEGELNSNQTRGGQTCGIPGTCCGRRLLGGGSRGGDWSLKSRIEHVGPGRLAGMVSDGSDRESCCKKRLVKDAGTVVHGGWFALLKRSEHCQGEMSEVLPEKKWEVGAGYNAPERLGSSVTVLTTLGTRTGEW